MALMLPGKTKCAVCGNVFKADDKLLETPGDYRHVAMHLQCFRQWPLRKTFIRTFNEHQERHYRGIHYMDTNGSITERPPQEIPYWELSTGGDNLEASVYWNVHGDFETPDEWYSTHSLIESFVPLKAVCNRKIDTYPDFFSFGILNIVSDRLRELFLDFKITKAEFLPVILLEKTNKRTPKNPYWYLHPLEQVDCIDHKKSDVEFWNAESRLIKGVRNLVIDKSKFGERHLAFPVGLPTAIVSDALHQEIKRNSLEVDMKPVSQIRLGLYGTKDAV